MRWHEGDPARPLRRPWPGRSWAGLALRRRMAKASDSSATGTGRRGRKPQRRVRHAPARKFFHPCVAAQACHASAMGPSIAAGAARRRRAPPPSGGTRGCARCGGRHVVKCADKVQLPAHAVRHDVRHDVRRDTARCCASLRDASRFCKISRLRCPPMALKKHPHGLLVRASAPARAVGVGQTRGLGGAAGVAAPHLPCRAAGRHRPILWSSIWNRQQHRQ